MFFMLNSYGLCPFIALSFFFYLFNKMNVRSNKKRNNKTVCYPYQNLQIDFTTISSVQHQQEEVSFQTHSLKQDLDKEEENVLFSKVLGFVQLLLCDRKTWCQAQKHFNKYSKTLSKITSEHKNERFLSFKKMVGGSKICFDAEAKVVTANEIKPDSVRRRMSKKISILIAEEQMLMFDQQDIGSNQSSSETSMKTIRSIEITHIPMNMQTITAIFEVPQPFLINLSLCIFTRYCLNTKRKVVLEESGWVLCVATVIAYKLYYDEQIQGLIDCFTGIMQINRKDLIDLERCFLQEIDYVTTVRNYDYYYMLNKLLKISIPTTPPQLTQQ